MRTILYKGWLITVNYRSALVSAKHGRTILRFDSQAEAIDWIDHA